SRAMRPAFPRGVVAVTLVPLLMAEFPSLLRLVFAEFRAVAIHHELLLMMVAQTIPLGSLVLPFRIFTPVSGSVPSGSVFIGPVVRLSRGVVVGGRRRCVVAWAIAAADLDGKASLRERRAARDKHKANQEL